MKMIYLAGYHKPENMINKGYLNEWISSAMAANDNGQELVVFKIPIGENGIGADGETVEYIEKYLQSRFGIKMGDNLTFVPIHEEFFKEKVEIAPIVPSDLRIREKGY